MPELASQYLEILPVDLAALHAAGRLGWAASPLQRTVATADGEWHLRVVAQPKRTVAAAVPAPPLGWTSVRPVHVSGTVPGTCPEPDLLPRLVRGKDFGDSYNYAPPEDDELVDTPVEERRETLEDGPVRRIDVVHRSYSWDGKTVDFRNTILIMTTNAGASDMARESIGFGAGSREDAQEDAVKRMFTPDSGA